MQLNLTLANPMLGFGAWVGKAKNKRKKGGGWGGGGGGVKREQIEFDPDLGTLIPCENSG